MPFETQDEAAVGMMNVSEDSLRSSIEEDDNVVLTDSPSFLESFGASLIMENEVGSVLTMDASRLGRSLVNKYTDVGINYFNKAVEDGYNPEQLDDMFFIENDEQYSKLKLDIDVENLANQTIADSGGKGIASMFLAGALSPIGFFTGTTALNATLRGAKALDVAKRAATAGLVASTAQEGILSASQVTRSLEQSAINIGAATVLSGILGGAIGKTGQLMGKKRIKDMEEATQKHLDDPDSVLEVDDSIASQQQHDRSIGAAQVPEQKLTLAEESIFLSKNPIVKGVTQANLKTFGKLSLSTRLLQSPSLPVRKFSEQIGDISLAFEKNVDKATDEGVLANIRLYEGDLAISSRELKNTYKEYLKSGETDIPSAVKRITPGLTPEGKVSYKQFKEMVSDAYEGQIKNVSDVSDDTVLAQHVIRASERASKLHKRISQEAFSVGMITEGQAPKGSSAWLNHVFVPEKVIANLDRTKTMLRKHFTDYFKADVVKATRIRSRVDAGEKVGEKDIEFMQLTEAVIDEGIDDYINESITATIRKLTSVESQVEITAVAPNDRGPFKTRVLNIPYREMSFILERDFEELMERAARTGAAEIELTRKFGSAKLDNKSPLIIEIKEDFERLISEAKTEKEKIKLSNQEKRSLSEVADFWDLVRGTYRANRGSYDEYARRSSAALRAITFLTSMGSVVIASALDPLIIARANGYSRFFKASIGQVLNKELRNLTKRQLTHIGKSVNAYNANRLVRNFELGDPMAKGSAFERGLHNATKSFGNLNVMNYWNDAFEKISGTTNSMRIYENLGDFTKSGKLSKKEEFWMNSIGISKEIRNGITEEVEKHGFQSESGIPVFNTQDWDDKNLARKVGAILNKKIGSEVVMKSVGDAPIFAESSTGKALLQFMSFGFAANNKILLSGLQQADARWLATEVNFLLGGVLVYAAQQALSGKELPEDNTALFLAALDKHPELMLPMMVNKVTDDMGIGLSNLTDNPQSFRPEKLIGTILGANYNTIRKTTNATLGVASRGLQGKEPTSRQIKDTRQSAFYNNIFYIKPLVNAWEKMALDTAARAAKRRTRKERRTKKRRR